MPRSVKTWRRQDLAPSRLGGYRLRAISLKMVRRFTAHRAPAPKTVTPLTMSAVASPRPGPAAARAASPPATPKDEIGGPEGPEPTRYGDWERKGICVDF
jgi:hypothetical protein